ncbi:hypothetical protein Tco_1408914 [Tanacetum coccineum]
MPAINSREDKRSFFFKEVGHRLGDFGKILNKSSVESGVTEKTTNTLHGSRMRLVSSHLWSILLNGKAKRRKNTENEETSMRLPGFLNHMWKDCKHYTFGSCPVALHNPKCMRRYGNVRKEVEGIIFDQVGQLGSESSRNVIRAVLSSSFQFLAIMTGNLSSPPKTHTQRWGGWEDWDILDLTLTIPQEENREVEFGLQPSEVGAGAGVWFFLSRINALTISFSSATSDETAGVEELVLTLETMALLRDIEFGFALGHYRMYRVGCNLKTMMDGHSLRRSLNQDIHVRNSIEGGSFQANRELPEVGKWGKVSLTTYLADVRELHRRRDLVEYRMVKGWEDTRELYLGLVGREKMALDKLAALAPQVILPPISNFSPCLVILVIQLEANNINADVIPYKVSHVDDSINLNVDESTIPSDPIVQSVDINTKSTSYAGATSASAKDQPKVNSNFRTLVAAVPVFVVLTISICRSSFARCLIEVNSEAVRGVCYHIGIPSLSAGCLLPNPPIVATSNVVTPNAEKTNDGFQTVGKKKKRKGKSKSTNDGQFTGLLVKHNVRYELKATTSAPMKDIMLEEEDDEKEVENVYDESANLIHNIKAGGSSSFTAAAG